MGILTFHRDGYVKASDLDSVLTRIDEAYEKAISDLRAEVKQLRAELDTERRLRMARK